MSHLLQRIPVVGALAYQERLRPLPSSFPVTLELEPGNRYFRQAIAVLANNEKVGYVAPEVARRYAEPLAARAGSQPVTCPARRSVPSDRETSGVELFLDFSAIDLVPSP